MKPYGVDLRERVVAAVEQKGWSQARAAEVFGVSEASVSRYRARQRAGQSLAALPGRGGPAKKLRLPEHVAALRESLEADPDLELAERGELLAASEGISLSVSTLWRELRALGWTRKKRRLLPASKTR